MSRRKITWAELIEENRDEIQEALEQACRDSMTNTCTEYHVILDADGTIRIEEDVAGNNCRFRSVESGYALKLGQYCDQFYAPEKEDDNCSENLTRQLSDDEQEEWEAAVEDDPDLEHNVNAFRDMYPHAYEAYKSEYEDWYIDECERGSISETLDELIETHKDYYVPEI